MYGQRIVECRYGENNLTPHLNQTSSGDWQRTFNNWRNRNWQRHCANQSSPYEMEKRMNVICTICHNFGHVAMNCRRRNGRGNVGPWRESDMACYHCHQTGHIARLCRAKMNQLVNQFVDRKGKKKVDVEETRNEMKKIWRKKSDEKPSEESRSSPRVENHSLVN